MSAPELHLDEEGYALPAPGEDSLGIEGEDLNLIGTLCLLEGDLEQRLEYSLIEGSCRSAEVKDYLDALAQHKRSGWTRLAWWSWITRRFTHLG